MKVYELIFFMVQLFEFPLLNIQHYAGFTGSTIWFYSGRCCIPSLQGCTKFIHQHGTVVTQEKLHFQLADRPASENYVLWWGYRRPHYINSTLIGLFGHYRAQLPLASGYEQIYGWYCTLLFWKRERSWIPLTLARLHTCTKVICGIMNVSCTTCCFKTMKRTEEWVTNTS